MQVTPVHVWLFWADLSAPRLARLMSILDADELRRADTLASPHERRRFIAAHGATRLILGRHLGVAPEEIVWRRGAHGKPELAGARTGAAVNLSHSGEMAAVAITRGRPVGVDVQELSSNLDPERLSARFYPAAEAEFVAAADRPARRLDRFVRLWTRKEACVKAAGGRLWDGLHLPVQRMGRGGGSRAAAGAVVHDPHAALPGPFLVQDVPVPAGFRAAVALDGVLPCRVVTRWWSTTMDDRRGIRIRPI